MRIEETDATIVALSTPPGRGAVAVIRMSGPQAGTILTKVTRCPGGNPRVHPRKMFHGWVVDQEGNRLDEVLTVFFQGPHSYTGEDMVEVHCHGGEAVVEAVLSELIKSGARPALRGEFTRRSFESGKLDLTRAEAIIRLIHAGSREQVRGALKALGGAFACRLRSVQEGLTQLLAQAEAAIDFPEEPEINGMTLGGLEKIVGQVNTLQEMVRRNVDSDKEVVLAGEPNVGKSSIINALTGRPVSIVTSEPGTTRDAVCADVVLGGMRVTLVDTAGQSDGEHTTETERESARVASERISRAGLLVWVTDTPDKPPAAVSPISSPIVWVVNKSDLIPASELDSVKRELAARGALLVSALRGEGLQDVEAEVCRRLTKEYGPADGIPLSNRQEDALDRVIQGMLSAHRALQRGHPELAAVDIRDALAGMAQLLGEQVETEEILDRIFEEFCIGK